MKKILLLILVLGIFFTAGCSRLEDTSSQERLEKQDISDCDKIQSLSSRDLCYIQIAYETLDLSVCKKIQDHNQKNNCFYSISGGTNEEFTFFCILPPGIPCSDCQVDRNKNTVSLVLKNDKEWNLGETIGLNVTVNNCDGVAIGSLKSEEKKTFTINDCNLSGNIFEGDLIITFTRSDGIPRENWGSITCRIKD